jgi:hypothetical protein
MKKILLAACAVLALTGAARGEDGRLWGQSGPWSLIQMPPAANACLAAINPGQDTLIISSDVDGRGRLVFGRNAWKLPEGKYKIFLHIDNEDRLELQAFTTTENSLAMDFKWTEGVYKSLASNSTMTITAGTQTLAFSLAGTAKMLPELFRCVGEVKAASTSNPFADQSPAAPASTPSNPFKVL